MQINGLKHLLTVRCQSVIMNVCVCGAILRHSANKYCTILAHIPGSFFWNLLNSASAPRSNLRPISIGNWLIARVETMIYCKSSLMEFLSDLIGILPGSILSRNNLIIPYYKKPDDVGARLKNNPIGIYWFGNGLSTNRLKMALL